MNINSSVDCGVSVVGRLTDKAEQNHNRRLPTNSQSRNISGNIGSSYESNFLNGHYDQGDVNNMNMNVIGSNLLIIPRLEPTFNSIKENFNWSREFTHENSNNPLFTGKNHVNNNINPPRIVSQNEHIQKATDNNKYFKYQSYNYYSTADAELSPIKMELENSVGINFQDEFNELEKELSELEMDSCIESTNPNVFNEEKDKFQEVANDIYNLSTINDTTSPSISNPKLANSKFIKLMKLIGNGSVNLNENNNELRSVSNNGLVGNRYVSIPDPK